MVYISSLGFYPVCPGSEKYAIGSPMIKHGKINLENGNVFEIEAINQKEENVFVEKIELNETLLGRNYLLHSEISSGGKLTFYMTNTHQ